MANRMLACDCQRVSSSDGGRFEEAHSAHRLLDLSDLGKGIIIREAVEIQVDVSRWSLEFAVVMVKRRRRFGVRSGHQKKTCRAAAPPAATTLLQSTSSSDLTLKMLRFILNSSRLETTAGTPFALRDFGDSGKM
jgi:hypothetical protein